VGRKPYRGEVISQEIEADAHASEREKNGSQLRQRLEKKIRRVK
jgi:hypothetical protein